MPGDCHSWLGDLVQSEPLRALADAVVRHHRVVARGSHGSSTYLTTGALALHLGRPVVLVVAHLDEADEALDDLELFGAGGHLLHCERFGALEVLPGESGVSLELLAERLGVVQRIREGGFADVLVAPVQALMQAVPEFDALSAYTLSLHCGNRLSPGQLLDWLHHAGYTRQEAIEQPGDYATRGGIIDIYPPAGTIGDDHGASVPPGDTGPIRLDYFGDQIDSICRIDLQTMGSSETVRTAQIIGAGTDKLLSDHRTTNLLELIPDQCTVVMHESLELTEQARGYYERLTMPDGIYSPNQLFHRMAKFSHVEINQYTMGRPEEQNIAIPVRPLMTFDTDAQTALTELGELASRSHSQTVVLCRQAAERDRLSKLLDEHVPNHQDAIRLEVGGLHQGFEWQMDSGNLQRSYHLVPHHELFHRYEVRRRVRQVASAGTDVFLDLEPGNHVVHVDHGIAKFTGLKTMRRQGQSGEYLTLQFADRALLHVPATQIDLIQKYIGGFHGQPPLSKLGGKTWSRQKHSVAEAVRNMAKHLLQVQAARETLPGIRYPTDTNWQKEFEAEFPYEETEDQLAAIAAIKADMSRSRPMDRLICGDVGFGKTEVAIRAAFKAAENGKQVAVLVPTTVLAEQHERIFGQRLVDYPFEVASLSRFKTNAEQRKALKKLEAGGIDIIIGTHRLLSQDVSFKDLGLLIIDEEQRFGVEHKNRLLEYRVTADVLTLTATPIPRTLHMSMVGLRDISSLSTAPLDRRAIVTEVVPFDHGRIKQAILRELNRDGQVYFVHNRVHNIQEIANTLHRLVPEARVIVGHGQMPPRELEQVMLRFIRREVDVLVATTIIESGIDIPTANTMFINQADHFGLADLHQLRGRVGRYKHRAYCYLLLPEERPVTESATKRLRAIEQYAMLGAGFKIAMRDLEIRGAGNLLGAEQSGHIAAVGYEMYCLLLEQETRRLRHEPVIEPAKTHLEIKLSDPTPAIPKRYISSDKFRMEAYRRLSRATTLESLELVIGSLQDAYGDPPPPAQALFALTELRIAATILGIDRIKLEPPDLIFTVCHTAHLGQVIAGSAGRITTLDDKTIYYRPPARHLEPQATLLSVLRKLLVCPIHDGAGQVSPIPS